MILLVMRSTKVAKAKAQIGSARAEGPHAQECETAHRLGSPGGVATFPGAPERQKAWSVLCMAEERPG